MTDYLTRVAQSALGLTPELQVLGPSRYAPGPDLLPNETAIEEIGEAEHPLPASLVSPPGQPSSSEPLTSRKPEREPALTLTRSTAEQTDSTQPPPAVIARAAMTNDRAGADARTQLREDAHAQLTEDAPAQLKEGAPALPTAAPQSELIRPRRGRREPAPPLHERLAEAIGAAPSAERTETDFEEAPARKEPLSPVRRAASAVPAPTQHGSSASPSMLGSPKQGSIAPHIAASSEEPRHLMERSEESPEPALADRRPHTRPHRDEAAAVSTSSPAERGVAVSRRPQRLPLHELPDAEPSSAPVIRVTIGRIEVRAAAPPPPPVEAPAPPPPRISLDDYLRSHNGRTR